MSRGEYIFYGSLVLLASLISSLPLFSDTVIANYMLGDDYLFHLNRIEGIKEGILSGQFPVRVHAYQMDGYGYLTGIFYPDALLYFPAFMRLLGVPVGLSYNLWMILVNLYTGLLAWYAYALFTRSKKIGAYAAMVYVLGMYRAVNLYDRGALGEVLAMAFLPLFFVAVYEVLYRRAARWPLITLALTGIFWSHILSSILASLASVLFLVFGWRQLKERERWQALLKAFGLSALMYLWFAVPFFQTFLHMDFNMIHFGKIFLSFGWPFSLLLVKMFSYGLAMILGLGCALLSCRRLTAELKDWLFPCVALGGIFLLMSVEFFPWQDLYKIGFVKEMMGVLQFPWRLLTYAEIFLAPVAGAGFYLFFQRAGKNFAALMLMVSLLLCGFMGNLSLEQRRVAAIESGVMWPLPIKDTLPSMGVAMGGMYDYLPHGIDDYVAEIMGRKVESSQARIGAIEKRGTTIDFSYASEREATARAALIYYEGYRAETEDGRELSLSEDEFHLMQVSLPEGEHRVVIRYEEKALWRFMEAISLLSAMMFAIICRNNWREFLPLPEGAGTKEA